MSRQSLTGTGMKAAFEDVHAMLPGGVSEKWPVGERFALAMSHGSMSVELYAPVGSDPQSPHEQDELYFIVSGTSEFLLRDARTSVVPGDVLFVPAGAEHRFEKFSEDFTTWAVFWGPKGGEN